MNPCELRVKANDDGVVRVTSGATPQSEDYDDVYDAFRAVAAIDMPVRVTADGHLAIDCPDYGELVLGEIIYRLTRAKHAVVVTLDG